MLRLKKKNSEHTQTHRDICACIVGGGVWRHGGRQTERKNKQCLNYNTWRDSLAFIHTDSLADSHSGSFISETVYNLRVHYVLQSHSQLLCRWHGIRCYLRAPSCHYQPQQGVLWWPTTDASEVPAIWHRLFWEVGSLCCPVWPWDPISAPSAATASVYIVVYLSLDWQALVFFNRVSRTVCMEAVLSLASKLSSLPLDSQLILSRHPAEMLMNLWNAKNF